jgi:hypothetical protein
LPTLSSFLSSPLPFRPILYIKKVYTNITTIKNINPAGSYAVSTHGTPDVAVIHSDVFMAVTVQILVFCVVAACKWSQTQVHELITIRYYVPH